MATEFELKYRADAAAIDAIRKKYGHFTTITMETTYYTTRDGSLSRRKWTLRRRMENGRSVCTLKTPGGGNLRNEWEVDAPDIDAAIDLLVTAGAPAELKELTRQGVFPVCGARFTRLAKTLELAECTLELALDQGQLMGGGKTIPLWEVEVELKSGSQAAAEAFAARVGAEFSLVPEARSKFRRALDLTEE